MSIKSYSLIWSSDSEANRWQLPHQTNAQAFLRPQGDLTEPNIAKITAKNASIKSTNNLQKIQNSSKEQPKGPKITQQYHIVPIAWQYHLFGPRLGPSVV